MGHAHMHPVELRRARVAAVINVNGRITDERNAVVLVLDHGFLFGEGVYETLRTYNRRPFLFEQHARRLRDSARMIDLPVPVGDEELRTHLLGLLAERGQRRADRGPALARRDDHREPRSFGSRHPSGAVVASRARAVAGGPRGYHSGQWGRS